MSVANNANTPPALHGEHLHFLFSQLDPQQVETFYKSYQQWHLEQQSAVLQEQLASIEQRIVDNHVLMQLTQPSPIALATLTRLQSYGVDDVDLLDSMLERGDTWLDHTLQLLEQCERLDVIHDNYTEWCRHALEGAYNWLDSMHNNEASQDVPSIQEQATQAAVDDNTEALLIQKLMSEDETEKVSAIKPMSEPESLSLTLATHKEPESVGTDLSRPGGGEGQRVGDDSFTQARSPQPHPGRDKSVPTTIETYSADVIQPQEDIPVPVAPVHEIPLVEQQQKSPKRGLVSRILARVWPT